MRYRENYTLIPRKVRSGKTIYYYRTYDENGKRTNLKSTGQSTKTAAKIYCEQLLKKGSLLHPGDITFNEYACNWWIYDKCNYVKGKLKRGYTLSRMHIEIQRMNLKNHILPFFGNKKLNNITSKEIETWLFSFSEKGLTNSTANHNLTTLRVMFNEAQRLEYIFKNPIKAVRPLKNDRKKKGILSNDEFKYLFDESRIIELWGEEIYFTANLLSAYTGMRLGEIQGLQCDDIKNNYIYVCHSLNRKYELKGTKTNRNRNVPFPDRCIPFLTP